MPGQYRISQKISDAEHTISVYPSQTLRLLGSTSSARSNTDRELFKHGREESLVNDAL